MNRIIKLTVILLFFSGITIYALGNRQTEEEPVTHNDVLYELEPLQELSDTGMTRAEQTMKTLLVAYPRQIDKVEFRNDDWAVLLRGTWYYYAEGKVLPENLLDSAGDYSRFSFYDYPKELPPWQAPGPEAAVRFRAWEENRRQNPPRRSPHFLDALWRVHNREEASQRLQTFRFLGRTIYIHYLILEVMSLVEEHILAAARTDPQVQTWINNIQTLEAFYWRNIAETQSRSYHSYGLAIDILPRGLGNRQTYWLWGSQSGLEWWNVSYNQRYHPPAAIITAFETFGFIWGGKWTQYDTMHFEYRPEILILNGMPPETRR